jgi:hypothetical protein
VIHLPAVVPQSDGHLHDAISLEHNA